MWPTWAKVAAFSLPIAITIVAFFLIIGSGMSVIGSGKSESWKWGYKHAGEAAQLLPKGYERESACRGVAGIAIDVGNAPWLDKGEATEGCIAGLKDRH